MIWKGICKILRWQFIPSVQGIGRAGRDGEKSEVYMLYNDSDHALLCRMLKHRSYHDRDYLHGKLVDLNYMLCFAQDPILCRHQLLCSQFGERLPKRCGTRCDNCLRLTASLKQSTKADKFDATWMCVCIFKTIICLGKSLNGRNDKNLLHQWLCTSSGLPSSVSFPMDETPTVVNSSKLFSTIFKSTPF